MSCSIFKPMQRCRGFTLIELLTVVVIVGILTSLALPSYRSFVEGMRIKNSSFDVMSALTLARSEAIKRDRNVTITPVNGDWRQGWTMTANGMVAPMSRQNALVANLALACGTPPIAPPYSACTQSISYNSNGRLAASVSPMQIGSAGTSSASTYCISIDLSGRPNSRKGNC
ncbi:GspH/FimT family pseudopilin [Sideroxydans lithotrophicus]|uniref:Type II secretion system protein H n=1 Tax=Sideroxydans lithotrophicus (strain ES-1) TaxID=580332 RepID=D5CUK7_SIDLE|nr:GspH/FimT family pseudopilin [Sideroxydans lithotrophicus]ADE12394.1 N-terminal methylation site [Sideroxydans lithotrophicus ES-1]